MAKTAMVSSTCTCFIMVLMVVLIGSCSGYLPGYNSARYRYLYDLGRRMAEKSDVEKRETIFMPNAAAYEKSLQSRGRFGFGIGKRSPYDNMPAENEFYPEDTLSPVEIAALERHPESPNGTAWWPRARKVCYYLPGAKKICFSVFIISVV